MDEALMSMNQVARYIGVSRRSIERWIANETMPRSIVMKVGKLVRIRKSDLDEWLQSTNKGVKNDG